MAVVLQQLSHVQFFAALWTAIHQASLSFTLSWSLLKLMSIESVMLPNHLILCYPLLLLPTVFPSIRVFPNELVLHIRWPRYWSFSFSISCTNKQSELISFRACITYFFFNCIFCLFIYLLHHTACRILVPQPGIELGPSAVRVQSSNHWTTREFPASHIQLSFLQLYKDQVSYLVLQPCFFVFVFKRKLLTKQLLQNLVFLQACGENCLK